VNVEAYNVFYMFRHEVTTHCDNLRKVDVKKTRISFGKVDMLFIKQKIVNANT